MKVQSCKTCGENPNFHKFVPVLHVLGEKTIFDSTIVIRGATIPKTESVLLLSTLKNEDGSPVLQGWPYASISLMEDFNSVPRLPNSRLYLSNLTQRKRKHPAIPSEIR